MSNTAELTLHKPCIVTVCGLHRRKGVHDLLEACTSLFRDVYGWQLYIAGEGPDRLALEAQVHSAGLSDRIIFLGFIPAPRTLFEQADIFVLCSYADPCSLVIGEARSAGCAILATSVGGTPEMLDYGRKGCLVPPGQPSALASGLRKLISSPSELNRLRRASLDGAEYFHVLRLLNDYEQVYQRALAPRTMLPSAKIREFIV
jgi:glycosyltransferase involved in cell wall biosynthesis